MIHANQLQAEFPSYGDQIEDVTIQNEKSADTVPAGNGLCDSLAAALPHDLYMHQATALGHLDDGENVCVATSTSSGKTLIYALHYARRYQDDPDATGLLIYPTKALSRDQKEALEDLYHDTLGLNISIGVYDGDTPSSDRPRIREESDLIITNFSGLNVYLPSHAKWHSFLNSLGLVAIDESHSYSGVEGMHVAWIIRRLKRVLDEYGASPQFTLTSATIGNPTSHAKALIGEPVTAIEADGSPRGRRDIIFWNPPAMTTDTDGTVTDRVPANLESARLFAYLTSKGLQTLLFTRSRKGTELTTGRIKQLLSDDSSTYDSAVDVRSYSLLHGFEISSNLS